jgi:hypothetical protein
MDDVMMSCLVGVTLDVYRETGGLECVGEMLLVQLRSLLLGGELSDVCMGLAGRVMDDTKLVIESPFSDDLIVKSLRMYDMGLFRFVVRYVDRIVPCTVEVTSLCGVVWGIERVRELFDEMYKSSIRSDCMNRLFYLCVEYALVEAVVGHPAHDCDDACEVVRLMSAYVDKFNISDTSMLVVCPKALDVVMKLGKMDDVFVNHERESIECEPVVNVFCDYVEQNNKRVKVQLS